MEQQPRSQDLEKREDLDNVVSWIPQMPLEGDAQEVRPSSSSATTLAASDLSLETVKEEEEEDEEKDGEEGKEAEPEVPVPLPPKQGSRATRYLRCKSSSHWLASSSGL